MLIICDQCNHKQSDGLTKCEKCGGLLNKDAYIICSNCGLSNAVSAKTCVGCKVILKEENYNLNSEKKNEKDLDSKSLFFEGIIQRVKAIPKKIWIIAASILFLLAIVITVFIILLGNGYYIQAEEGFYYISQNKEFVIIDEEGDKSILLTGVDTVDQVRKFKKKIYFIADQQLYLYDKNKLKSLGENVHSYQLDLKADQVLYTVFIESTGLGELYLYDGKKHTRIDGNVGHRRYIFSKDQESIYYVKDVTEEEMLGTLYYKKENASPVAVAEDVYMPLISLQSGTCYFTRSDIEVAEKFELYYLKNKQIIEIDRHVKHMFVHPEYETIYFLQYKNNKNNLLSTKNGNVKSIAKEIKDYGQFRYGDLSQPLIYLQPYFFFYRDSGDKNYYVDNKGQTRLNEAFDDYWLSNDQEVIYIKNKSDWSVYDFKKANLIDGYNVATASELLNISSEGKYAILEKENGEILLTDKGKEIELPKDGKDFQFSLDDKFFIYDDRGDLYVHKINAKEPVFLSEQLLAYVSIDDKIFIFEPGQLHQYELGKYKSKKQIDTYIYWSFFE